MYRNHTHCRACGYARPNRPEYIKADGNPQRLQEILDLGLQPLANDFKKKDEEQAGYAPLKLMMCPRCGLAQLSVVVDPHILYKDYPYVTSRSATMETHFGMLLDAIGQETNPLNCIEIGSNDGHFLEYLQMHGVVRLLGIDPAENLAHIAQKNGILTTCGLFNADTARQALNIVPHPDLIVARHVFCHVDEWNLFIVDLERLCQEPNVLVVIEVPYAVDMIARESCDQIYHEHLSYLNVGAMCHLLEHTQLKIQRVVRLPIHGGVIALMLRRKDFPDEPHVSLEECLELERDIQRDWMNFGVDASAAIAELQGTVMGLRQTGASVCGYGAPAKSTVWINACKFTKKDIAFLCDSTPAKQGRFSPGTDIPVVDEGALLRELPDYAIIFAWNFAKEIMEKNKRYTELGGKWIIPVPEIQILPEP